MLKRTQNHDGWILAELIVSIGVLAMLMIGLYQSLNSFKRYNRYQLSRQQCISAAQAKLDSIGYIGEIISDKDIDRLWPGVKISVEKTEGSGIWKNLTLVTVTSQSEKVGKKALVKLSRYIPAPQEK